MKENSAAVFAVTKNHCCKREKDGFSRVFDLGKYEKQQYNYPCPKEHYSTRCAPKKISRSVLRCHGRPPVEAPVGLGIKFFRSINACGRTRLSNFR